MIPVVIRPLPSRLLPIMTIALATALTACAGPHNYVEPSGPRYSQCYATATDTTEIRVVTFNIKYSKEIEKAIDLIENTPGLRGADILLLQEMDATGVHQIAFALGMCYVYYPATVHPSSGRDFGDAILSRWPITNDRKIILPHNGRFGKTQRIAVTGTITVHGREIQLYSLHLATWIEASFKHRKDQARAVVKDAKRVPDRVIVGGDLNSHDVGEVFTEGGFAWPTREVGRTAVNGKLDHIFLRGLGLMDSSSVGVVHDNKGASDHRPVWAVIRPPG
jgi:endonuclease/exonuclease/phosphatase family metal-dependent hydrolase